MNITVVIPAYNEAESIGRVLESICGENYHKHVLREVLVYDDSSTDDTARVVETAATHFPAVRLIRGQHRAGCANAVQRLLNEGTSEIIVKVNADVALERGAIEKLAEPIAEGAQLAIGAQIPVVERRSMAGLASSFSHEVVERLKAGPFKQHYAVGHFCSYARDAIRGLVFPSDLINDDHFIANEIARAGGRIVFVPGAACRIKLPTTPLDYWRVSRRILEGERQLRRRGMGSAPLTTVLAEVARTAIERPFQALCWAPMYVWSSCKPSPTKNSRWPAAPTTKGPIE